MRPIILVFVHGYSVSNFSSYGELPLRLGAEAEARGYDVRVEHVFLARYITFNDEVRLDDISLALHHAVIEQLTEPLGKNRFVCITHSTGGPVVRNWWKKYYSDPVSTCPMSHLIMLSPANYGSALAQLGKSKLSRMKSWLDGVEPGQNILDWLELGSDDSCALNKSWIIEGASAISGSGIFPFVITGQDIDRELYDHINSYTGEPGSDGVIRVASANLNSRYIQLIQQKPINNDGITAAPSLEMETFYEAPRVPLRILRKKAHSHSFMGIMKSVKKETTDSASAETVDTILRCIGVENLAAYKKLTDQFESETKKVQEDSRVEVVNKATDHKTYIHDRHNMIIFRVSDSSGQLLKNFDLILTAEDDDPDKLPAGFFRDRQCNMVNHSVITYYFNYDLMKGSEEIKKDGVVIRPATSGINKLGLIVRPRPDEGFMHYLPCSLKASADFFEKALQPNSTTIIDICLKRIVASGVFRLETLGEEILSASFKDAMPGMDIIT